MKIYSRLASVAIVGLVTLTAYAATSSDVTPPAQPHKSHPHMMLHHSPFIVALHKLDLTDAQRASIKTIIDNSRTQAKAEYAAHNGEYLATLNPGDPNYADAVRKEEAAATARIERRSQDKTQIYNLLTAEQKAKLPEILASIKTHREQHRAEWQNHLKTGGANSAG